MACAPEARKIRCILPGVVYTKTAATEKETRDDGEDDTLTCAIL